MKSILNGQQEKLMARLSKNDLFDRKFYLTGGTALSEYYLHHRLSEDLDFFSEKEIDKIWLVGLAKKIKNLTKSAKLDIQESFNRNLVYFHVERHVLKTEFTYFPFIPIEKPKVINGLKIDSLIDIAVNKFFTIYLKPSSRHFIDLYLLLKGKKIKWENLLKLARVKFDTVIDPLQLGSQLITVSDIKDLPKMIIDLPDQEWKNFFIYKAQRLKVKIQKK